MDSLHCEATQHSSNKMFMTPTGSDFIANGDFDDNCKNKGSSEKKAKIKIKKSRKMSTNQVGNKIMETVFMDKIKESIAEVSGEGKEVLSHLGNYIEEPYQLIESYFKGQHLERLVRHQIESYNHFINYQIQRTIQMFNPVNIHSENDYVAEHDKYLLDIHISFLNFKLHPPQIHENNGATKVMLPEEAKLRNFTYASTMTVDLDIQYTVCDNEQMDNPKVIHKLLPKINIGKMPIMLKSSICILNQNSHIHPSVIGECAMDCGGYFIIKGSEKTV